MDARYFHLIDRQGLDSLLHPEILSRFDRDELFADFQAVFNHPIQIIYQQNDSLRSRLSCLLIGRLKTE